MNKFLATFILIIYSFTIFPISIIAKDTSYTYDCLGRCISTILPDESETVQEYSIKDGKKVTTSTDSLGNITEITKNERGCTTHIARLDSDYNLLTETSYVYTDIGELIEVIDAKGNKITSTYDLAGRRLTLESKDTGLRTWEYDAIGNVIEESNSVLREKEQSITYHYDTFGRLILKDYPNLKDTIYTYGKSTDVNLAGRLIKREDSSGSISYEYGKLGEITKETRTLESFINYMDVGQFVTKDFEYKSNYLGQMEEITYPDGEVVTYSYDDAGQVNAITGINTLGDVFEYVKKIGYDEYSQRTLIEYGSGVVTEYSYDPARRWLKTMRSVNLKGEILQNYTYTFDTAGNVTSYINDCLGSSYQTTEQKYTYDALYQLIKVEGECKYSSLKDNYIERDDTYSQIFQYDNIGNLIRKTSQDSGVSGKAYTDYLSYDLEYEYNSDYAHRLNKIGHYYYQYDSNGNITAYSPTSFEPEYDIKIVQVNDKEWYLNYNILEGPKLKKRTPSWQRTIFYDDRNQMCEVSDFNSGKQNAYYHYDEDGKRTSKLIWNLQEVLSFGELFSLWLKPSNKWELGQTQKSIMLGNTRLVSKIDSATKGSIRRWKDEHTFYYLSDHIGTTNFITTYEGEIYQITEYTPYGERWIERTQNKYNEFYLPYRFAGKPLDEETGWYYFGARYYDPKYQIWTTSDPALSDYFSDTQKGEGGVFNHINLNTYHYAGNNPIKYVDPDGNSATLALGTGAVYGLLALGALLCIQPAAQALESLNVWVTDMIYHSDKDNGDNAKPPSVSNSSSSSTPGTPTPDPNKNDDNNGNGGKHGNHDHDSRIRQEVENVKNEGGKNIRMNQKQVNKFGEKVGNNRPDLQWNDVNGEHHVLEVDHVPKNGYKHQQTILKNDPTLDIKNVHLIDLE